jgi:Repeat of unknown function (DUF5648)
MEKKYKFLAFEIFPSFSNLSLSHRLSTSVRRLRFIAAVALLGLLTTAIAPATVSKPVKAMAQVSLYQLYNPTAGLHFYTTDWNEVLTAIQNDGYLYERVVATVDNSPGGDRVPLYRLFNPTRFDHFYTISWEEALFAIQNYGYRYERIEAYIGPPNELPTPLYRLYHPVSNDHFLTTDWNEVIIAIQNNGYRYDGVGGSVY